MELLIMGLLVLTSVVSVTFIVERGLALRMGRVVPPALESALENCRSAEDLPRLREICMREPSALGRLLMVGAEHRDWPKEENENILQTKARHEIAHLERGLVVLEIATGIAPLLGLVGTVYGMIVLFANIGMAGMADTAAGADFARGIALALRSTLGGLLIAIPSLVAWSYYTRKVETMAVEMENLCEEFLRRMYRSSKA